MFEGLEELKKYYQKQNMLVEIKFTFDIKILTIKLNTNSNNIPNNLNGLLELDDKIRQWYLEACEFNKSLSNPNTYSLDIKLMYVDMELKKDLDDKMKIQYNGIKIIPYLDFDKMELIENFLHFKQKEIGINDLTIKKELEDKLNEIYQEYLAQMEPNNHETEKLKNEFMLEYKNEIKYFFPFFKLNFVMKNNSNGVIIDDVENKYPIMYSWVKNKFLPLVPYATGFEERRNIHTKQTLVKKKITSVFNNGDEYLTFLFKYYWKNILIKAIENGKYNLCKLLKLELVLDKDIKALGFIWLFEDYKISYKSGSKFDTIFRTLEFENDDWRINYSLNQNYSNEYKSKYLFDVINKNTNEKNTFSKLPLDLIIECDNIYGDIIDFITTNSIEFEQNY